MTIEQAIASYEKSAERYHKAFLRNKAHGGEFYQREAESDRICEEHERQLAAWLRELQERRKEPEIITGEWELKDYQWECDKCGCRINVKNPLDCDKWNYYYCPHCGAKMLIAVQRGR